MVGKVDMEALVKIYQRQRQCLESDSSHGDVTQLDQTLQSLWQVIFHLNTSCFNLSPKHVYTQLPVHRKILVFPTM